MDAYGDGEEDFLLALDRNNGYDLAVIDRMLPVVDGLTIIKAMRNKQIQIPVIIITGMSELQNKVEGQCLSFHDISLDLKKRLLSCRGSSVTLTPTEFHLMRVFLEQPDTLLTKEQ